MAVRKRNAYRLPRGLHDGHRHVGLLIKRFAFKEQRLSLSVTMPRLCASADNVRTGADAMPPSARRPRRVSRKRARSVTGSQSNNAEKLLRTWSERALRFASTAAEQKKGLRILIKLKLT